MFRGKFLDGLAKLLEEGRLDLPPHLAALNAPPTRRRFLHSSLLSAAAMALPEAVSAGGATAGVPAARPRVVSTWDFGVGANQAAWKVLAARGAALDAVEAGARWAESDLCNASVGRCGNPDRDGVLTLDSCIMDGDGRCGSVAALEDILQSEVWREPRFARRAAVT